MSTSRIPYSEEEDVEHIPLINTEDDADDPTPEIKTSHRRSTTNISAFGTSITRSSWSIFLLSAFLVSFISALWSGTQNFQRLRTPYSTAAVASLRHPSLYMGLDRVPKIKAKMTDASSSKNIPTVTTAIAMSPGGPHQVIRVNSDYPQVNYVEDGWILLTEKDIVIAKFQPPEGVAMCKVAIFLPSRSDLVDKMLTLEGQDTQIKVQTLPPSLELDKVYWSSLLAPSRTLGSFEAGFGQNGTTSSFSCRHDMPVVLKFSCIGKGCRVEYKEGTMGPPLLGIKLLQA